MSRWVGTVAGALFLVSAGGFLLLRSPVSGRLPVAAALARAVPLPGGVLPPSAMERTWYAQTDSAVYFRSGIDGRFSDVRGTWTIDQVRPAHMAGDIQVGIASLRTGDGTRDADLKSAEWLDEYRYHDMTAQLTGVSGWPAVLRRGQPADFEMESRLSVRGVTRDVPWQCALEPDVHRMRLRCTASVGFADFGLQSPLPAPAPIALTAQLDFADQPG